MQWIKLSKKSRSILAALAEGRPCEQILADDHTVTYHDIFHAAAEAPEEESAALLHVGDGGAEDVGGVSDVIAVDLHIRGCPPSPHDILKGLIALLAVASRKAG